jgi:argininosuccinate lyase
MSFPNVPDINPCIDIKQEDAVNLLLTSIAMEEMSLSEFKSISPVFEQDIYEVISLTTCVNKRTTIGAPGKEAMDKVIRLNEEYLLN